MKKRDFTKKFFSVELVFVCLVKGVLMSGISVPNSNSPNFIHLSLTQLTLVGVLLPWSTLGAKTKSTKPEVTSSPSEPLVVQTSSARGFSSRWRASSNKETTSSNALLENIDFLTQLTNSKQGRETDMDPLKCFPKALCGLSAESAAITRRRKDGLITDYIRLMKAVSLNPSVMEETLKKYKKQQNKPQKDEAGKTAESDEEDEEDEDDDDDDDEEEDDEAYDARRHTGINKRTSYSGFEAPNTRGQKKTPSSSPKSKSINKRKKRKQSFYKNSDEFTKDFLAERAEVEKLMEDGFYNEDTENTNWWNYEKEMDPSLEDMVDSGTKLDSSSSETYYTFGGKMKPNPPNSPDKPGRANPPATPPRPYVPLSANPPPPPRPPSPPLIRVPDPSESSTSTSTTTQLGNFFRTLFGFGTGAHKVATNTDPFFQGFQRSMADGTPTVVTVDKTKEILTTAIEIGETLRSPNQCNSLFNGCKYQYIELLHVIDDIRKSLAARGKDDFETPTYGTDDELDDKSSYGYKFSLSGTSQAETLAPDYTAAESEVSKTKRRSKKSKKIQQRDRKIISTSTSKETQEIASDEPTLYGSAQQDYNFHHQQPNHGPLLYNSHNYHHHSQHSSNYHNGYYSSYYDQYNRQPKTMWANLLSWFGFGR